MTQLLYDSNATISREPGWLSGWVMDELVMMNAESSDYVSLSQTGGRIWELLEEPCNLGDLCMRLSAEYEIDSEQALTEIIEFLRETEQHHVLRVSTTEF